MDTLRCLRHQAVLNKYSNQRFSRPIFSEIATLPPKPTSRLECERNLFIEEIHCKGWTATCEDEDAVRVCINNPTLLDIEDMRSYIKTYTDDRTPDLMIQQMVKEYNRAMERARLSPSTYPPLQGLVFIIYFIDPDSDDDSMSDSEMEY